MMFDVKHRAADASHKVEVADKALSHMSKSQGRDANGEWVKEGEPGIGGKRNMPMSCKIY